MRISSLTSVIAITLSLAAGLTAPSAHAQAYPTKPITLIVPYAAGGSVDAVARLVSDRLGAKLGTNIVVENVSGAGGVVGTARAARAAPDGYTLLFSVESTIVIAKLVSPSIVQYDAMKDFVPISMVGSSPLVLLGRKDFPANNIAELMKLLKENPGKYNYATSGVGTSLHVAGEMINAEGKVQMVHVPYKTGAQIPTDLMGNQIDLAVLPLVMAMANVRAGNIKAFGITEPQRFPLTPDVPSLAEHPDLKNVSVTVWYGLFAPAKTDPAIVEKLYTALAEVVKEPGIVEKLKASNLIPVGNSPKEFADLLKAENEKFSALVKAANIKAE
ncbi:tripartite tricarboxylate transporter substrate binding protein [Pseudorhodoplanes sp.]|uniref:Bug family tripartite tricarboxylate transporter substrate binding protein n=1 Tax=Pseudorhodoplanes sp. TaxID=1934341 RepID=UPI002B7B6D8D|nr:tripartite tricarboxylate transporter substrate binding protein [Pseudorhodoplanes sp.]HWV41694.1 tripartite tricarboxylate transporter substrate binding protein [Pseudorhodoplanes sp.]